MEIYHGLLIFAAVHTAVALVAVYLAEEDERPWGSVVQGSAEVCCALLLWAWFEPSFGARLGASVYPIFLFALGWAVVIWARRIWALAGSPDETPPSSVLGAFGLGVSSGVIQVVGVVWHVCFVAPSVVCGVMVLANRLG